MTKAKVLQIGFLIAFIGFLSYKLSPVFGLNELTTSSISSFILITIVLIWILSYLFRVVNGDMTFIEQRRRYREKYENLLTKKLEKKFNALSSEEQEKLINELKEK